jgi:16S rRNA (cytidine1402-2'-O)-methyltransferase
MPKLVVVPTPVGNLNDITLRALEVLKNSELIIAEDTRTTGVLLKHFQIAPSKLVAFHLHNEHKVLNSLVSQIKQCSLIALVSDAGTPAISDPGFLLVRACIEENITVECLPGATALIPALVVSGFPTDRFIFEGFLPPKKGRVKRIESWKDEERTIVLYESPHKLNKTLQQIVEILGQDRLICVVREISKKFEEVHRGTVREVQQHFIENEPRGELVVVIKGIKR